MSNNDNKNGTATTVLDLSKSIWKLTNSESTVSVSTSIPNHVHTALIQNGIIGDPYVGGNDKKYRWIAKQDWTYTTTFSLPSSNSTDSSDARLVSSSSEQTSEKRHEHSKTLLICHGIDTVSSIVLNNIEVGKTENMFRRYVFDVTSIVKFGDHGETKANDLKVEIKSAVSEAKKRAESYPYEVPDGFGEWETAIQQGERYRNFLRKEQCSFSWDWGPCFCPSGIWQPIEIVAIQDAGHILDVVPQIFLKDDVWVIEAKLYLETHDNIEKCKVKTTVGDIHSSMEHVTVSSVTNSSLSSEPNIITTIRIPANKVERWWPNGYGRPTLYNFDIECHFENGKIAKHSSKIGFREVELVQRAYKDREGESFFFKVNGVDVFAKGTNFIPMDCFEDRVTRVRLRNALNSMVAANMNMLRVWGGGIYQQRGMT